MRSLTLLVLTIALAGCPPPPRYAIVDVRAPEAVDDALVAAECGPRDGVATRTDDLGRARLPVSSRIPAERCTLIVAKPGYATVQADGVQLCTSATACPPTVVDFGAARDTLEPEREPEREYARPPGAR